ncbi:MAG: hypothetical protein H0U27_04990 [Nitrosopumilus sp.]|nr:hypothetical protein [Nitrosopumilus sp.]
MPVYKFLILLIFGIVFEAIGSTFEEQECKHISATSIIVFRPSAHLMLTAKEEEITHKRRERIDTYEFDISQDIIDLSVSFLNQTDKFILRGTSRGFYHAVKPYLFYVVPLSKVKTALPIYNLTIQGEIYDENTLHFLKPHLSSLSSLKLTVQKKPSEYYLDPIESLKENTSSAIDIVKSLFCYLEKNVNNKSLALNFVVANRLSKDQESSLEQFIESNNTNSNTKYKTGNGFVQITSDMEKYGIHHSQTEFTVPSYLNYMKRKGDLIVDELLPYLTYQGALNLKWIQNRIIDKPREFLNIFLMLKKEKTNANTILKSVASQHRNVPIAALTALRSMQDNRKYIVKSSIPILQMMFKMREEIIVHEMVDSHINEMLYLHISEHNSSQLIKKQISEKLIDLLKSKGRSIYEYKWKELGILTLHQIKIIENFLPDIMREIMDYSLLTDIISPIFEEINEIIEFQHEVLLKQLIQKKSRIFEELDDGFKDLEGFLDLKDITDRTASIISYFSKLNAKKNKGEYGYSLVTGFNRTERSLLNTIKDVLKSFSRIPYKERKETIKIALIMLSNFFNKDYVTFNLPNSLKILEALKTIPLDNRIKALNLGLFTRRKFTHISDLNKIFKEAI